jgi:hypothetical protein
LAGRRENQIFIKTDHLMLTRNNSRKNLSDSAQNQQHDGNEAYQQESQDSGGNTSPFLDALSLREAVATNGCHPTTDQRWLMVLLVHQQLLHLHGSIPSIPMYKIAELFGVDRHYPGEIYRNFKDALSEDVCPSFEEAEGRGRPTKMTKDVIEKFIAYAEANRYDFTYVEAADFLETVTASTLCRWCKNTGWRIVCERIIPSLSLEQRQTRLSWAQQHRRSTWEFWVDVDEKWFYGMRRSKLKLPPGKTTPARSIHSKSFIPKVMLLAAVAKPMPEYGFDGKIGMWRVATKYMAKKKSKNHEKGEKYDKDVTMTAEIFYEIMTTNVIPAAVEKMQGFANTITFQMDGAKPHTGKDTLGKLRAKYNGTKPFLEFVIQPPPISRHECPGFGCFYIFGQRPSSNQKD